MVELVRGRCSVGGHPLADDDKAITIRVGDQPVGAICQAHALEDTPLDEFAQAVVVLVSSDRQSALSYYYHVDSSLKTVLNQRLDHALGRARGR